MQMRGHAARRNRPDQASHQRAHCGDRHREWKRAPVAAFRARQSRYGGRFKAQVDYDSVSQWLASRTALAMVNRLPGASPSGIPLRALVFSTNPRSNKSTLCAYGLIIDGQKPDSNGKIRDDAHRQGSFSGGAQIIYRRRQRMLARGNFRVDGALRYDRYPPAPPPLCSRYGQAWQSRYAPRRRP